MTDSRAPALPDAAARRRAADDFERNFVVLAGAGTGKTSLLVERVLCAVGRGVAEIREIAALTFTEKAAGEMRQRVADGLERLRAGARGEIGIDERFEADRALLRLTGEHRIDRQTLASRAVVALEQLDRATIETIHRFCGGLLRANPFEAGVDPDFTVDAGQQAELLRRSIWESFVVRELGPGAERRELWRRLLRLLSLDEVGQAAQALADFAIPTELLHADSFPAARSLFGDRARAMIDAIDSLLCRQSGMTRAALAFFAAMRRCLQQLADEGLEAFRRQIDGEGALVDRLDRRAPRPNPRLAGVAPDEMSELVKRCCRLARRLLEVDETALGLAVEAALPYVREFREAFLRGGFVSFDGLLVLARDLLLQHPAVRRRCKRRLRLLLVDEFQDTDPLQYEIVLLLAEDPQSEATDAYAAALTPGRLFAVGDAKQSIYRFRGADYRAYRRAVDRIVDCGGVELTLQANFRSLPGVIEPVNRLFAPEAQGCWIASEHQPEYVPIRAVRQAPDGPEARVEIWTVTLDAPVTASERRDAEGERIADAIADLVRRKICRHGEIALLFRAFTEISHYLRPLREREIPFVVDGGRDFLQRPEVVQLMAALRALSRPADQAALLAFLRSPAGGVSDIELFEFADRGGAWDWRRSIDGVTHPRISACFARLRELRAETRELPADAVVRRVLERTLLLPLGAAAFEGAQRVANLRKLASAASELARDGRLSLDEVVEALREGRLTEITTDAPLADSAEDAILITSIHRMKGLESSWVFLPDFARGEARGRREATVAEPLILPDGSRGLALAVQGRGNAAAVFRDLENERHTLAEEVRVLYVALTRARDRLVVVAGSSRQRAPWIEALRPWGYDGKAPPEDRALLCSGRLLHRRVEQRRTSRQRRARPPRDVEEARRRYDAAFERLERARAEPPFLAPSSLEPAAPATPGWQAESGDRGVARAAGIAIHRLLEHWNGESWEVTRERLRAICAEIVDELGVAAAELAAESEELVAAFLDSPLAERLRSVEIVGREIPVLARHSPQRTLRGTIDLLYRESDGRIVVADFKTDRAAGAEELRERYGAQLRAYGDAARQALALDRLPALELWSLRAGGIVTVDR